MNTLTIVRLVNSILVVPLIAASVFAQNERGAKEPSVEQLLGEMAEAFSHKISDTYSLVVQLDLKPSVASGSVDRTKPTIQSWQVSAMPGRKVRVGRELTDKVQIIFYTTEQALRWLSVGTYNPMTAVLRSKSSDPVMIYWERPPHVESTPELREKVRIFHQTFFDTSLPHRYQLNSTNARFVHGSRAVGLYYAPGLRSAWYEVTKGNRLNEPGDVNPLHQAFIFISGKGKAKIGDRTVEVKAGESYYIPPKSDHVVWTETDEPLVLIWLAWGEGA